MEGEVLASLREALELHFAEPVATETPQLRTIEVSIAATYRVLQWSVVGHTGEFGGEPSLQGRQQRSHNPAKR